MYFRETSFYMGCILGGYSFNLTKVLMISTEAKTSFPSFLKSTSLQNISSAITIRVSKPLGDFPTSVYIAVWTTPNPRLLLERNQSTILSQHWPQHQLLLPTQGRTTVPTVAPIPAPKLAPTPPSGHPNQAPVWMGYTGN